MSSNRFGRAGAVLGVVGALACVFLCPAGAWAQGDTAEHVRRQYLLDWAWEKVQQDSDKVMELAKTLQAELKEDSASDIPEGIEKRIDTLFCKTAELNQAVRGSGKNQLSFVVVTLAEEIEQEGNELEKVFKKLSPAWRRNKYRDLAKELRKKAKSVKNRMRTP